MLPRKKKRAEWRQTLVDAERGMTYGVRRDSTFFVHFFIGSIVLMAALVLGISYLEWGILVLAMTVVLTAEMFNQILKAIWNSIGHQLPDETNQTLRIGTAGVFVAILGAGVTVLLILVPAALRLFAH